MTYDIIELKNNLEQFSHNAGWGSRPMNATAFDKKPREFETSEACSSIQINPPLITDCNRTVDTKKMIMNETIHRLNLRIY